MYSKTEFISFIERMPEAEFTHQVIAPLFEAIGFCGVRYEHGPLEKGKDLIFWRSDEFGDKEWIAAQIKVGKFTGNIASKRSIRPLIYQLQQVFDSPFTDLSGNDIYISKCFLVISSVVSANARESIKGLLRSNNIFRPVKILDGPEILSLIRKYAPSLLRDWKENISEYAKALESKFKYYLDYKVMGLEEQPALEDFFIDVNLLLGVGAIYFRAYSEKENYNSEIFISELSNGGSDQIKQATSLTVVGQIDNIRNRLRAEYKVKLRTSIVEPKTDQSIKKNQKGKLITKVLRLEYKELAQYISSVFNDLIINNLNGVRLDYSLNDFGFNKIVETSRLLNTIYPILQHLDKIVFLTAAENYESISVGQSADPKDLFLRNNRTWLIGNAGTGKTTLLRYNTLTLARQLDIADKRSKIPVFIPLTSYDFGNKSLQESVQKILCSYEIEFHQMPYNELFDDGRFILFLDGLDEISSLEKRNILLNQIESFCKNSPKNNIIISSRFLETPPQLSDYLKCHTTLFTETQLYTFCKKWFRHDKRNRDKIINLLSRNETFRAIAKNPLYLTLIASLIERGKPIPQRRIDIYSERLELLLHKWDSSRDIFRNRFEPALKLRILKKLAIYLHTHFKREFDYSLYKRVSMDIVPVHFKNAENLKNIFEEIILYNELIRKIDETNYDFGHLSFQEYFVALEIADTNNYKILFKNLLNPWWQEACLMFCGILRDASKVIDYLLYDTNEHMTNDNILFATDIIIEADWTSHHYVNTVASVLKYKFENERKTEYICRLLSMMNSIAYDYFFEILIREPMLLNNTAIKYYVNESVGEAFYSTFLEKIGMLDPSCNEYILNLMIERNTYIEREYLIKMLKYTRDSSIRKIIKSFIE